MKIPFARVVCDGRELAYIQEVLESGWLTTAGKAQAFEQRFAEAVDAPFACAVNSGTAALHLGLEALSVGPGDQVLVPTMTFTATAEVVRYLGADPIFWDVEADTNLLTPADVDAALDRFPRIKVVIVVHFGGQPAAMVASDDDGPGILDVCANRGVKVLEDAAHAFPARDGGRMVGGLGDATCFSFYANKTITSAEGGMLTTADEALNRRVRVMRLHGIDRDIWNRYRSEKPNWDYDVVAPGYKYNMPDLNAAVGLAQLERAEALRDRRQHCARFYLDALSDIEALESLRVRVPMEDHAWHLFVVRVRDDAPLNRDELATALAERGIGTAVHYKPLHRMTYYRERYNLQPEDFPNAETMFRGCLSLPIYPALADDELAYIGDALHELLT